MERWRGWRGSCFQCGAWEDWRIKGSEFMAHSAAADLYYFCYVYSSCIKYLKYTTKICQGKKSTSLSAAFVWIVLGEGPPSPSPPGSGGPEQRNKCRSPELSDSTWGTGPATALCDFLGLHGKPSRDGVLPAWAASLYSAHDLGREESGLSWVGSRFHYANVIS